MGPFSDVRSRIKKGIPVKNGVAHFGMEGFFMRLRRGEGAGFYAYARYGYARQGGLFGFVLCFASKEKQE